MKGSELPTAGCVSPAGNPLLSGSRPVASFGTASCGLSLHWRCHTVWLCKKTWCIAAKHSKDDALIHLSCSETALSAKNDKKKSRIVIVLVQQAQLTSDRTMHLPVNISCARWCAGGQ